MYKSLPVYKELISRGFAEITDEKRKFGTVVLQPRDQTIRKPISGDRKYIIHKSGYLRSQYFNGTLWGANQIIISRWAANRNDYVETGLELLLNHLRYKGKEIDAEQSAERMYKLKNIDEHKIVDKIFTAAEWRLNDDALKPVLNLFKRGRKYQAINRLIKELGIMR